MKTQSQTVLMDTLESRTLLSSATLGSHGLLTLSGDASATNTITVGLSSDGTQVVATVDGVTTSYPKSSVKRILMSGGAMADTLSVDETNGPLGIAVAIFGHAGNDTINAGSGNAFVSGGAGDDSITAGDGNDVIFGGPGNDTIVAGNGRDFVFGGLGNDSVTLGNGGDTVFGLAGDDTIRTGSGNDVIYAAHTDHVDAGAGNNTIYMPGRSHPVLDNSGGGTDKVVSGKETGYTEVLDRVIARLALGKTLTREL